MYFSTFFIDDQMYAFELGYVQEYVEGLPYTNLPQRHNCVVGIANLRGQIVSIYDLKERIVGECSQAEEPQYLVIRANENLPTVKLDFDRNPTSKEPVAMMMDQRGGVMEIPDDQIKPGTSHGDGEHQEFIKGMIPLEDEMLLVLDIVKVLGLPEETT